MVVLLDTNVLLDVVVKREPYWKSSIEVIQCCAYRTVQVYISAHSVADMYYV